MGINNTLLQNSTSCFRIWENLYGLALKKVTLQIEGATENNPAKSLNTWIH